MSIRITAIRLTGTTRSHEHISNLRWIQDGTSETKESTRATMYEWVKEGGKGYVKDSEGDVAYLRARESSSGNGYVQTWADGIWTDNLLALPRF